MNAERRDLLADAILAVLFLAAVIVLAWVFIYGDPMVKP